MVKAVQAGSSDSGADAANLINGSGLRDRDLDGLEEHASNPGQMWLSAKGETKGWLEFDFGQPQTLSTVCIWNYNDTWHTDRGLQKADLSVWTQDAGWRKLRENLPLEQAEGGDDYDEPVMVQLDTVQAQKVRLDNLVGLGDGDHVGLSEVQFFQPRGPAASRPSPRDGAEGVGPANLRLAWAPGEGAAAHNLYLGTDPENLQLLGKVTEAEARLTRLADQTKYCWRADEIQADGTTTQGRTWSFATSGLLAWWRLDESEGQRVADASIHGNTGTLVGDPNWQPAAGRIGGALELDGEDDHIRIDNEADFDITDEITVAAWVKVRAFDKTWQTIVAKGDRTWRLARDGDRDMLQFVAGNLNEDRIVLGNVDINDGRWHHVVGVADANQVSLYVDGVLDSTKRARGKVPTDDQVVCIGENAMYPGRAWDGWIDEVCIFTYALNADEIKALHSGKEPTAIAARPALAAPHLVQAAAASPVEAKEAAEVEPPQLVAWWKLDETDGVAATDSSGNGYSGVLAGNPQWQPGAGKVAGALQLDGTGDYVEIENEPAFDLTKAITVAAWVKVSQFDKSWQTIIAKGDGAWRLARDTEENTAQFATGVYQRDMHVVRGRVSINDGDWHHVAGVYDSNTIRLYVDGRLDVSGSAAGRIPVNDYPVFIGENCERRGREWNGLIDDVCVFGYALDANEVEALYAGKDPIAVAGVPPTMQPTTVGPTRVSRLPSQAQAQPLDNAARPPGRTRNIVAVVAVLAAVGLIAGLSTLGRRKSPA